MSRKVYRIIWIVWLLSTVYLLFGAITFNHASFIGLVLIAQSQLILLGVILISTGYVYPKFWNKDKWLWLLGSIVGLNLACVLMRYIIEEVFLVECFNFPATKNLDILFYLYENFYYTLPGFFIALIIFLTNRSFDMEKLHRELQSNIQEAELHTLKSQINPHFLYNILNYIYAEALPVSTKISDTILKLASTMRYTLAQTESKSVFIGDEVQFIQEYIHLQAIQFDGILYCDFTHDNLLDTVQLPSLLLLPFVENAFKHGVVVEPDTPVIIDLHANRQMLHLRVSNQINRDLKDHSSGIGLKNIQRRLSILYPGRHALLIRADENRYYVDLTISFSI